MNESIIILIYSQHLILAPFVFGGTALLGQATHGALLPETLTNYIDLKSGKVIDHRSKDLCGPISCFVPGNRFQASNSCQIALPLSP